MKKTGFVLLALAFLFTLPSWAEVYCQTGYELAYDEDDNVYCIPEGQAQEETPTGAQQRQSCEPQIALDIRYLNNSCSAAKETAYSACDKSKMNAQLKPLETKMKALQQAATKRDDPNIKKIADDLAKATSAYKTALQKVASQCKQLSEACSSTCEDSHQKINQFSLQDTACSEVSSQSAEQVQAAHSYCQRDAVANLQAVEKEANNVAGTSESAKAISATTAASTDPNASGGATAAADTTSPASTSSSPSSTDTTSTNAEDTTTQEQQKKKSGLSQSDTAALMGAATSLLNAFMQPEPEQATVDPVELAAGDCRRPENMSTLVCRCQTMWTPECSGTTSSNSQDFASNGLPGVGGASLNKETGTPLSLPNEEPVIEWPSKSPEGGGASAAGLYGGGGGMNPPPANFKPDAPGGKGGSSLSADILSGTYGGGTMGGLRGAASGLRPLNSRRGNGDIEDKPGYMLGKKDEMPDFNRFMPPGAGNLKQQGAGQRGISGLGKASDLHPSNANIFEVVSQRYKVLEGSLYP